MAQSSNSSIFNARDFGATGDGDTKDSPAIQSAIDACTATGGGVVLVPPGDYRCGTILLRSNVVLELSAGATLHYSTNEDDFEEPEELPYSPSSDVETAYFRFSLLFGQDAQNIAIQGRGVIEQHSYGRGGPKPIALKNCQDVTIRDIFILNAPNYNISLIGCDNITIENVTIRNGQADGIDFDNCRRGRVANCYIDAFDDGVCLKTSPALGFLSTTEDITVTNCTIATSCYSLKIGTETSGDCRNIAFANCSLFSQPGKTGYLGGVALQSADGSHVENVVVSNLTMVGAHSPVFLRLGNRGRGQETPTPGSMERIAISNIVASHATWPCVISGIPGFLVRDVSMANCVFSFDAFPTDEPSKHRTPWVGDEAVTPIELRVPEVEGGYPDVKLFGKLPAWGVYCRHAENLSLKDLQFRSTVPVPLAGMVFDGVQHLDIDGCMTTWPESAASEEATLPVQTLWLHQVQLSRVCACQVFGVPIPNIRVSGADTRGVFFLDNGFPNTELDISMEEEVDTDQIAVK